MKVNYEINKIYDKNNNLSKKYADIKGDVDKDGIVIARAPFNNNLGLWVDSDMKYEDYLSYEICTITKNDFILLWNTPIA